MSMIELRKNRTMHAAAHIAGNRGTGAGATSDLPAKLHPPLHSPLAQRRITIGEVVAVAKPTILKTLLGSCVAVCLRDPGSGVAGMNHILLPEGAKEEGRARFGVHAMELLINRMMMLGADRRRLVAKAFGGGNVLTCLLPPTVGDLNAKFVHNFLALEGIRLMAHRLGGESAVEIRFRTDTGKVGVRNINGSPLATIAAGEETYRHLPPAEGDITIF